MNKKDVIRTINGKDPVDVLKYIEYRFCRDFGVLSGIVVKMPNYTVKKLIQDVIKNQGDQLYAKKKRETAADIVRKRINKNKEQEKENQKKQDGNDHCCHKEKEKNQEKETGTGNLC